MSSGEQHCSTILLTDKISSRLRQRPDQIHTWVEFYLLSLILFVKITVVALWCRYWLGDVGSLTVWKKLSYIGLLPPHSLHHQTVHTPLYTLTQSDVHSYVSHWWCLPTNYGDFAQFGQITKLVNLPTFDCQLKSISLPRSINIQIP